MTHMDVVVHTCCPGVDLLCVGPGSWWRRVQALDDLLLQHGPVKDVIVLVVQSAEQNAKQLPEVHVIGCVGELQVAAVVQVHGELGRKSPAQDLHRRRHFFLAYFFVLLLLRDGLEALPRQTRAIEVHEDVAERLEIVPPRLLATQVSVDARVAGRAGQVLVLAVRNVLVRSIVAVLLRQTEIDEVDLVARLSVSHEEVVRLDVAVDEILIVDELDAADHLVGQHQHRLHGEAARAKVKQVLETRAE